MLMFGSIIGLLSGVLLERTRYHNSMIFYPCRILRSSKHLMFSWNGPGGTSGTEQIHTFEPLAC